MTTSRTRGWCPTLYRPMPSGDGLLLRVKPPGARLDPEAARALADAALAWGSGVMELTQKGNVQVRGVRDAAAFARAMVGAGLAHEDPGQEARRAVMPPPLMGDDPSMHPGAGAFVRRLEAAFATHPDLAGLPAKFAVAVDAGGVLGGRAVAADMVVTPEGALRPAAGGAARPPAGALRYGDGAAAFGLVPPFGQFDAGLLREAAALAEAFGTTLRVTPWRALMLARVPEGAEVAAPGWIVDPADPLLFVTACPGSPGCASGEAPARADAARLRPSAAVHVSGCPKGCAHPGPAATVLVGRDGRYDLVRSGRAGDPPLLRGLSLDEAAALV